MNFKSLILTAGIAVSGIVASGASSAHAALIVNTTNDATALGTTITGPGISASGFTYTGGTTASGTFDNGLSAGIGINSGVILTTGNANLAIGSNTLTDAAQINNLPGDADLTTLGGATTYDASVLEFDFTTTTNNVFLNFVFASEEYPEFVGQRFNDVFAFFVDGQNIALVPGTSQAVSINNVNSSANSGFYNDNTGGTGIQYDGFTNMITAEKLGLAPGTHRIKIAIADVGDADYDSAIFLQLNSFANTPQPAQQVPEPFTIIGTLVGGSAALRMRKKLKDSTKA